MTTGIPLYLHAGFHKTGTTAIQHCAAANRGRLHSQGVLYPEYSPMFARTTEGHHLFAHALADKSRHLTAGQARELAVKWHDQARREGSRVFLSAEPVCRHFISGKPSGWRESRLRYLQRLADALKGFEVEPVLVLRRQDDFVRSLYQERVARGSISTGFQSFCNVRESKARFLEILVLFREVFGTVRVLLYEDLVQTGLLSSFFSELNIGDLQFSDRQVVRGSLSVGETLIKARLNPYVERKRQNNALIRWLRSWRVRWALRGVFQGDESFWRDGIQRQQFLAGFSEENDRIGAEFLDGRQQLFPELSDSAESKKRYIASEEVDEIVRGLVRSTGPQLRRILGPRVVEEWRG